MVEMMMVYMYMNCREWHAVNVSIRGGNVLRSLRHGVCVCGLRSV